MLNFVHDIPTKLYFGKGQIKVLPEVLAPFGRRVLLTYGGGSIKRSGLYDDIMKRLTDFEVFELGGIDPNPRIDSVRAGVKLCRDNEIDVILAVGGGSTIDCSKAIACGVYYENDDLWEMVKHSKRDRKALPLVDVLTLAATGSEFDRGAVITNLETKEKLGATFTFPSVSICDPTYTFSVSAYQTAAGSADIMTHIFEGYFSRTLHSDLSEGIAEAILKSTMVQCPKALANPEDYEARANLMANASVACSGIPEYGKQKTGWPLHSIEHELSAYYDITHGVGLAILTPRWMRHILNKDETSLPRFIRFAKNVMGLEGEENKDLALKAIDALEAYYRQTGIPMTLTELGIDETHFEAMASHANPNGYLKNGFVALTDEDIVQILKDCL